jgi:hypothetical protein
MTFWVERCVIDSGKGAGDGCAIVVVIRVCDVIKWTVMLCERVWN